MSKGSAEDITEVDAPSGRQQEEDGAAHPKPTTTPGTDAKAPPSHEDAQQQQQQQSEPEKAQRKKIPPQKQTLNGTDSVDTDRQQSPVALENAPTSRPRNSQQGNESGRTLSSSTCEAIEKSHIRTLVNSEDRTSGILKKGRLTTARKSLHGNESGLNLSSSTCEAIEKSHLRTLVNSEDQNSEHLEKTQLTTLRSSQLSTASGRPLSSSTCEAIEKAHLRTLRGSKQQNSEALERGALATPPDSKVGPSSAKTTKYPSQQTTKENSGAGACAAVASVATPTEDNLKMAEKKMAAQKGGNVPASTTDDDDDDDEGNRRESQDSQPGAVRMFPTGTTQTRADSEGDIQIGGTSMDFSVASTQRQEKYLSAFLVASSSQDDDSDSILTPFAEESGRFSSHRSFHTNCEDSVKGSMSVYSHTSSILLPRSSVRLMADGPCQRRQRWLVAGAILVLLLVILALALGLTGNLMRSEEENPEPVSPPAALSTLERITLEGALKCGFRAPPAVIQERDPGKITGWDAHLCYAIAAALQVEVGFVELTGPNPSDYLANGTIDVLTRPRTHTMERDLFETRTSTGYSFSVPYLYVGLQAAGDPFFVLQCADRSFYHLDECSDLRVCVQQDSTHEKVLSELLSIRKIVPVDGVNSLRQGLVEGQCNVIVHEGHNLAEILVRDAGYTGEYTFGHQLYSKEPLAILSRSNDAAFSDLVNSVLQALMVAEDKGITQKTAQDFPVTEYGLGTANSVSYINPTAYRDAIAAVGNYGELYERFLEPLLPRQPLNMGYTAGAQNENGLLYAHPFGKIDQARDDTPLGATLRALLEQGFLRCGVRTDQPGLAWEQLSEAKADTHYSGMDADYCRAIAASLFAGSGDSVRFVPIQGGQQGAQLLLEGKVDVVAGAPWTLEMDLQEPTTMSGFSLSQPYFYGSISNNMETACMMTRQDDAEWTTFVYWIITATIYAEEKGIHSDTSNEMPEVYLLGPIFQRMLRDPILVVGNYVDIYERNMQEFVPREAPNTLNGSPFWGPQHHSTPGFV